MTRIEVDKRRNLFAFAVFVDSISIVGGIQKELLNTELQKICFHRKKRMEKRKHIVLGSSFQKRKYRKITMGIGCHIHVEVVTEEIAFPMGVPSPAAVWLGVMAFAVTGRAAFLLTRADPFFFVGVRRCGQEYRHQLGPDALDGSVRCGWNDLGTAACRDGK